MRRSEVLVLIAILVAVVCLVAPFVENVQRAARQMESANNIKLLLIGVEAYQDTHRHFPPAASFDPDGNPLLSWRVLTVPFLEKSPLYKQFNQQEPWDSPQNLKLLASDFYNYSHYDATHGHAEHGMAHYQVFVGPGTAFDPEAAPKKKPNIPLGLTKQDFPDGVDNTIFIVEARDPVPWTKPHDLSYSPHEPIPPVGLQYTKGSLFGPYCYKASHFLAGFGDGTVRPLPVAMEEELLRQAITRNDSEK